VEFLEKQTRSSSKRVTAFFHLVLPAMKKLTLRAIELNRLITERGIQTIEVHPTSTRKALNMPDKRLGKKFKTS
jgi:predicted nuclease with RNAse H fold